MGSLFGGGSSTSKTVNEVPAYIKEGGQKAVGIATSIANQPYQAYTGPRVAALDPNQSQAINLSATSAGGWQPALNMAGGAALAGGKSVLDADLNAYMNPYIKGALDPAALEMQRVWKQTQNENAGRAAAAGAYGEARADLLDTENTRNYLTDVGNLYAGGYANAFNNAQQAFFSDRDAASRMSGQLSNLAGQYSDLSRADIGTLMTTGQLSQEQAQKLLDTNYGNWAEQRDWQFRGLGALTQAIGGLPNQSTSTTTQGGGGSGLGQIAGLALSAASLFSSKEAKNEGEEVPEGALAGAIADLPMQSWSYKPDAVPGDSATHVGPYAEDFHQAFGLGDGKTIPIVDAIGVTMGAVKDLAKQVKKLSGAAVGDGEPQQRTYRGALGMAA